MRVMVTGGAGYIGSQTVRQLVAAGHEVTVLDDMSTGHRGALPPGVELVEARVHDAAACAAALAGCEAVLHFAASIEAGESVTEPDRFWLNNVVGTLTLLRAMVDAGVDKLVFSSTAAVYGDPPANPIPEESPLAPTNPYGQTKLAAEMAIRDHAHAYGLSAIFLRYFNAAGADPSGEHGPDHHHKTHLITLCMEAALGRLPELRIFGTDYPTRDGTCIRDYIHVADLADAHLLALAALCDGKGFGVYNLGNGEGHTVREVVDHARAVTGVDFPAAEAGRREGDPEILIASSYVAMRELGWQPRRAEIDTILADAWRWHSAHPQGYGW
ncbi:MAG: UDP-glucose 4-epimerase GalE [Acidimicrobiia bacterium]|nr:UDP-glucose 4-epimerase GalE [Acidimicrobiia bacterium]